MLRLIIALLAWLTTDSLVGQSVEKAFSLPVGMLPDKILSGRTVVIYDPSLTFREIETIHRSLVRTGIDAVGYCESDRIYASDDVTRAFVLFFEKREIANIIFVGRQDHQWTLVVIPFNGNPKLFEPEQSAWKVTETSLHEVLNALYRTALSNYKRQNWLINDVPEKIETVPLFAGNRNERFAIDLKAEGLAVQKTGDARIDALIEEVMKAYPLRYQLVSGTISEAELRKQGLTYLLRFINTRNEVARQLLGYSVKPGENAFVSVTYSQGQEQIKTIDAHTVIYKVYVRHVEFGHVFLGPKWDADVTPEQALRNFIYGMRTELRLN
jgi:hypothetical protein